jgi:hypothetical protein
MDSQQRLAKDGPRMTANIRGAINDADRPFWMASAAAGFKDFAERRYR